MISLNATEIAEEEVGDAQKANVLLLGVALAAGVLPVSYESVKQTIEEEMRDVEANWQPWMLVISGLKIIGNNLRLFFLLLIFVFFLVALVERDLGLDSYF